MIFLDVSHVKQFDFIAETQNPTYSLSLHFYIFTFCHGCNQVLYFSFKYFTKLVFPATGGVTLYCFVLPVWAFYLCMVFMVSVC